MKTLKAWVVHTLPPTLRSELCISADRCDQRWEQIVSMETLNTISAKQNTFKPPTSHLTAPSDCTCIRKHTNAHSHSRWHTSGYWWRLCSCSWGGWGFVGIQQGVDPVGGSLSEISEKQRCVSPHQAQRAHFLYLRLCLRLIACRRSHRGRVRMERGWSTKIKSVFVIFVEASMSTSRDDGKAVIGKK